jgi:hypothetical protein
MTKDQLGAKRRGRIYVLSREELAAIAEARASGFASNEEVKAFWKRHGIGPVSGRRNPPEQT